MTAEPRPCVGTPGDPHGLRDPVPADEMSDALNLDGPRLPVKKPRS